MTILGLGHDVVEVAALADQLAEPGTRMLRLFSARERRQAGLRASLKHDGEAVHLAARWAGKEAVLKAWCEALGERPLPYGVDDFPWAQVEILDDARSRPRVVLGSACDERLRESLDCSGAGGDGGVGASGDAGVIVSEGTGVAASGDGLTWHISLSHDGPVASAVVVLER